MTEREGGGERGERGGEGEREGGGERDLHVLILRACRQVEEKSLSMCA